jgi:cell division septation protein DedD
MREKFDVTLDNRQIVSLLIAGIVVMGAVFVLGVVVGKKLAGDVQTAAAPDLLSALDANAQALQEVRKEPEPPLTFPDELTKKAAPEPAAPKVAAAPKPSEPKPAEPKPKPAEPQAPARQDEEPVLAAAPKPAEPARESSKETGKETGKVESEPVPTRTTAREGGGLKEAIARAAQPPRPTETVNGGAFTLQLSAFQSRAEADRFAGRLRDRGYAPYIVSAEVPKKGTWYRVRMGSFASKEAAARYLADFKRETQLDAFVAGAGPE